jgi:hypothetical protein
VRGAIGISVVFHLAVVTAAWTGLPVLFEDTIREETPIIVELVAIAEETRAAPETPQETPKPEPEEAKPEPVKAEPKPPPPPAKPAPPAPEKVAALPPPPKPVPKPEVAAPPPPPETRVAPEPPAPEQRQTKIRPKTKPEPPKETPRFDAGRIAVLIDKTRKDETPETEPEDTPKKFLQPPPVADAPVRRAAIGNRLTISEVDAIRYQIEQCWNVPAGARDARDLVIKIRINLKPDGSLKGPPVILDRDRMDDGFFRAAAESARRAVQRCTPLKNLPTSKYDRWQEITLTFNPRDMLGG